MTDSARCEIQIPPVKGLEDGVLTVGRHVVLNCRTAVPAALDLKTAQLHADPAEPDLVRLFSMEGGGSQFRIELTFYRAGEHPLETLVLEDGVNGLQLTGAPVKVESVLRPPADGKPQQPFGPVLPFTIGTPLLYYGILLLILALLGAWAGARFRRLAYYRRLRAGMESYKSPVEPDSQFYRAVRAAEKTGYPAAQLEKAFRVYMLRAYHLPMFDLPDQRVLRYFRHNLPKYKSTRQALQKVLGEFETLRSRPETPPAERAQFVKKLYRFVDSNRGVQP